MPSARVQCSSIPGVAVRRGAPRRAFLRNPTSCDDDSLATTLYVDSWTHPGVFKSAWFFSHLPLAYPSPPIHWGPEQGLTGCDMVPFDPSLTAGPASTAQAGQPLAFSFEVDLPQSDHPSSLGQVDLRWAAMTLPEGALVSPVGANGFDGCSPAQIGLGTTAEPTCPDASKIGSATITTPLLSHPLTGSAYLATPNDNPFGSALAIYLVADGPGLIVKLPWEVQEDPDTGQLTAISDDLPQLPLSNLHLELSGGPHAWMTLPDACETFTTYALVVSWSGHAVASESSFEVSEGAGGGPCPTPPPLLPPTPGATPVAASPGGRAPSRSTPRASVAKVGRTRVRDGVVLVPLACSRGSGCSIIATLKHRLRTKVGVVGRASTDVAAGQRKTLRVGLNRLGRRLLRRFGKLRVTLRRR